MTWRPKNLQQSLLPTTVLSALIGYTVFLYPLSRKWKILSWIYMAILTIVYWAAFARVTIYSFRSDWFGVSEKKYYAIINMNLVIATTSQILHCVYFTKFLRCIKRLMKVDETLAEFGTEFNYSKCFRISLTTILCWLSLIIIENGINSLWFRNKVPPGVNVILICVIHHPVFINIFLIFNFCCILGQIGKRFEKLNELLEKTLHPESNKKATSDQPWTFFRNRIGLVARKSNNNGIITTVYDEKMQAHTLKHVHLELTLIAKDFNNIYGLMLLLENAAFFVMCTVDLYILYNVVMGPYYDNRTIHIILVIGEVIGFLPLLVTINYVCERVTTEAGRTSDIVHSIDPCEDSELNDELKQFSLQIMKNSLSFAPIEFFTLGYPYIKQFFSAVVTYLVILIQMGSDPNLRLNKNL